MMILLFFIAAALAWSAPTVRFMGATQTQALLEIGGEASCTLEVSESPTYSPLIPDVDPTLYSGSSVDTTRPDTIVRTDGRRVVTIGHMTGDRALFNETTYYWRVTCNGSTTGTFRTASIQSGATRTEAVPFNAANWGNLGYQPIDRTNPAKIYVDPLTGTRLRPLLLKSGLTWRNGGSASQTLSFTDWTGGTGWTNPQTILNGASSTATTSNTNPLDLYADLSGADKPRAYDQSRTLTDIGIAVWGSGTDANAANRTIGICIFKSPSACASSTIFVVLPTGSVAPVSSGSSDPDGVFPAAFPSVNFSGWNTILRNENLQTYGTATLSGNTLTIGSLTAQQHFSDQLAVGAKVYVSGSSCTNNLCTVASVSPSVLTLSETPGSGTVSFRAYGWGIRVWKTTATGSVTVGLKHKLAGAVLLAGAFASGDYCGSVEAVSGDGKKGYVCQIGRFNSLQTHILFIANDGETRLLSTRGPIGFDSADPKVWYAGGVSSGQNTIFKLTYTGDFTSVYDCQFQCNEWGASAPADQVTTTDLIPGGIDPQIQAYFPAYNSSLYGNWTSSNTNVRYYGSFEKYGYYVNTYGGQDASPAWIVTIDLTTGYVQSLLDTFSGKLYMRDGTIQQTPIRWGVLHTFQVSNPNSLVNNTPNSNNPSKIHGGPFRANITGVMRSGAWSTNTALPWPPDTSYDRACPPGVTGECAILRLSGHPCNVNPHAQELSLWPCPWNGSYAQPLTLAAGDSFVDWAAPGSSDSEHFRVLDIAAEPGNQLRVTVLRNSPVDFCSISYPNSAASASQFVHSNGWTLTMTPTGRGCNSGTFQITPSGFLVRSLGRFMTEHSATAGEYITTARKALAGNADTDAYTTYNEFSRDKSSGSKLVTFESTDALIGFSGGLQTYLSSGPLPWVLNITPYPGCIPEFIGCGSSRTLTPVSGSVYKITLSGSVSASLAAYKTNPLLGWAGRYQLQDISGPSSLVTSTPYSMCYVMTAGECYAGSTANEIYVNVPYTLDSGRCEAGISFAATPCVAIWSGPAAGISQMKIDSSTYDGATRRFLTNAFSSTGRHFPYVHPVIHPSGKWAFVSAMHFQEGWGTVGGWLFSIPSTWQESTFPSNVFRYLNVKLGAGAAYAQVEFGYSRYGLPSQLRCSPRAESCRAASTLYEFASETLTPVACASGCTFKIPIIGGNILYFREKRSSDGSTWTARDVEAVALP